MPYSRELEAEADDIGMYLAARACFDVRRIPEFWQRLKEDDENDIWETLEMLSTHPSNSNRVSEFEKNIPKVVFIFILCATFFD